jgi:AcrR family transcriptional regulator
VPKLWADTIETHRRDVRDAVIRTTANLIAEQGLLSVTMSRIAEETGVGRATLYKYFPDVESILVAWHERQIATHLQQLLEARDRSADPEAALRAVLEAYALMTNDSAKHHDTDIAPVLHSRRQVATAEQQLHRLVSTAIRDAAKDGTVRADISPDELATYSLNALAAAATLPSKAAVMRLVAVTLAGMRAD